jgi:hypothetical protein
MSIRITDAARVIRSKNSGPFELTLDVLFKDRRYFDLARRTNVIDRQLISRLYGIAADDVASIIYFEPAQAVKITMRRRVVSGAPGDTDIYGAQQHAPLLDIEFPE